MAGKAKKKPAKMASRNIGGLQLAGEDGHRFAVVDAGGARVYAGNGVGLAEAVRLATTLVTSAGVARIEPDGTLTRGRIDGSGHFAAVGE
jgi:hypothetical protein